MNRRLIKNWDNAFVLLEDDINKHVNVGQSNTNERGLLPKKVALVREYLALQSKIAKTRELLSRNQILLPKEKTFLIWAEKAIEQVETYFSGFRTLADRKLWLSLTKSKMLHTVENDLVGSEDLIDMMLRQKQLDTTLKGLRKKLRLVQSEKADLIRQYEEFEVTHTNITAASSFYERIYDRHTKVFKREFSMLEAIYKDLSNFLYTKKIGATQNTRSDNLRRTRSEALTACRDLILDPFNRSAALKNKKKLAHHVNSIEMADKQFNLTKELVISNLPKLKFTPTIEKHIK